MERGRESDQWRHDQWRSRVRRMIVALDAHELRRQQRSAGASMTYKVTRDTALLQEEGKEKESLRRYKLCLLRIVLERLLTC